MKDVQFDGNLKADIEMSTKKFSISKKILEKTVSHLITFAMAYGGFALFNAVPMNVWVWFGMTTALNSAWGVHTIRKDKEKFETKKSQAISRLNNLACNLKYEDIPVNINDFQNSQIVETKSTSVKKVDKDKIKTEGVDRNIYFLDGADNLQVLNEKRNTTTTNGNSEEENYLTLFEQDDLPSVQNNVEKRLVLKR